MELLFGLDFDLDCGLNFDLHWDFDLGLYVDFDLDLDWDFDLDVYSLVVLLWALGFGLCALNFWLLTCCF